MAELIGKKLELRLADKEISEWLLSRDWLTHYTGRGDWQFAHFVQLPFDEVAEAEKCPDTEFPIRNRTYSTVTLSREYMGTYTFPRVHLKIAQSQLDDVTYDLHIHFGHLRTGDNYEQVFYGYVRSLDELKSVFTLLGLDPEYID